MTGGIQGPLTLGKRPRLRTGLGGQELWRLWRDQFDDDLAALAEAVWAANKLVKTEPPQNRDRFYALKDEFILRYATSGRRVRDEAAAALVPRGRRLDQDTILLPGPCGR